MELKCSSKGMFDSNVYVITNENKEAVIIDAGASINDLQSILDEEVSVKYIFLTHGHVDHIYFADQYKNKTKADIYLHEADFEFAVNPLYNCSIMTGEEKIIESKLMKLRDGDELDFGSCKINIISTPGHTPGGICIKMGKFLFTGDTLFNGSVGRSDFYKGNMDTLISSIKDKLLVLDENIEIYPGHGLKSTIGKEKNTNMFLK